MTTFVIVSAAMVAAALLWLILPLLRRQPADAPPVNRKERSIAGVLVALVVPALAALMYSNLSNWDFDAVEMQTAGAAQMDDLLQQLEAKLQSNPEDVQGWLLLGKSYTSMGRFARAADAFQQAYDLSKGEDVEATIGLGEALALVDQASLTGRAGRLFDAALVKAPNHPKALWYGSMAALEAGDLRTGRDRLQMLLAQNPPEELRGVLERQIQDLNQQLGEAGEGVAPSVASAPPPETPSASAARTIRASVSIAPEIREQFSGSLTLFILARDPAGGPPLAAQRHSTNAAPLTVELSERDAMMPTRTLASAARVEVVARISKSGSPQAQSGDFQGEVEYDFASQGANGVVNIVIDRIVP